MTVETFFHLLRYSIGADEAPQMAADEWADAHAMAAKQSLLGVMFTGVERMKEQGLLTCPRQLMLEWFTECENIERANRRLNEVAVKVTRAFARRGYRSCLLKGQGCAAMYPNPLRRTTGDIDIWLEGTDRDIIAMVRSFDPAARAVYHHIAFPSYKDIEVEVHYRPSFVQNLRNNRRLQRYFSSHSAEQFANKVDHGSLKGVAVPTHEFSLVYQLAHINQHVLKDGIGLRQLTDYYFLLRALDGQADASVVNTLRRTGLWPMACAVMYVMGEVFGMDRRLMIAPPDERRGRAVMAEVVAGGNFGQYDERFHFARNAVGNNMQRLVRDGRLARHFTVEALSEPLFRLYHFVWRVGARRYSAPRPQPAAGTNLIVSSKEHEHNS